MKTIRKNVFETNSSSVHAFCWYNNEPISIPQKVHFGLGTFGREFYQCSGLDYFWTGIYNIVKSNRMKKNKEEINKNIKFCSLEDASYYIKNIIEKYDNTAEITFEIPYDRDYEEYYDNYYQYYFDHGCILNVYDLLEDEEKFMQTLFGGKGPIAIVGDHDNDYDKIESAIGNCELKGMNVKDKIN